MANVLTRVASRETFVCICVVQKLNLFVLKYHQLSEGFRRDYQKLVALWG